MRRIAAVAGFAGALLAILPLAWLDWMKADHLMPSEKILAAMISAAGVVLMVVSWFVLRTFFVVAAELGLVLIIAFTYGELRAASSRSPQKRTMADLRTIATALEARATDMNEYPSTRSIDDVARLLEPTYVKNMPRKDAWRHELKYEMWLSDPNDRASQVYAVGSAGRDWKWDKPSLRQYAPGATNHFDCDIIYSNGGFVCYPEGIQQQ